MYAGRLGFHFGIRREQKNAHGIHRFGVAVFSENDVDLPETIALDWRVNAFPGIFRIGVAKITAFGAFEQDVGLEHFGGSHAGIDLDMPQHTRVAKGLGYQGEDRESSGEKDSTRDHYFEKSESDRSTRAF